MFGACGPVDTSDMLNSEGKAGRCPEPPQGPSPWTLPFEDNVYQFNLSAIVAYAPLLPKSIGVTLLLTAVTVMASTLLAFPIAKARMSGNMPFAMLARAYVELFRNIPILVLLYVYYFGLAET